MRQCQCQGTGHCCVGPKQTSVSPPAHEDTDGERSRRCGVDGGEIEKRGERDGEGKKKGRLKEKD